MWLSEVPVDPLVGLTAERWDLLVLVLCVCLFGLGLLVARSLP